MKLITIRSQKPLLKDIPPLKIQDKIRTFFESETSEFPKLPVETSEECLTRSGYKPRPPTKKPSCENGNDPGSEYTPSLISPSTCVSKKSAQKLFVDNEHEDFCKFLNT